MEEAAVHADERRIDGSSQVATPERGRNTWTLRVRSLDPTNPLTFLMQWQ